MLPVVTRMWLMGTLIYCIIVFGAVDPIVLDVAAVSIGALCVVASFLVSWSRKIDQPIFALALLISVLAAYVALQGFRSANVFHEHPVWSVVRELVGSVDGALSVSPRDTVSGLVVLTPLLCGLCTFMICGEGKRALVGLWWVVWIGTVAAVWALFQHLTMPDSVMFGVKRAYVGSLTGTFINRNTAGCFFGIHVLVCIGVGFAAEKNADLRGLFSFGGKNRMYGMYLTSWSIFLMALVSFVCILLTNSRGATVVTIVCIVLLVALSQVIAFGRSLVRAPVGRIKVYLVSGGIALAGVLLISSTPAQRMHEQGVDKARLCVYLSTLQAAKDNWPYGVGLGNFEKVFPAYRDSQCAGLAGTWEFAHNSWLQGTMELGAVFVVLSVCACVYLLYWLLHGVRIRRRLRSVPAAGVAIVAMIAMHSIVDFPMQIPGVAMYASVVVVLCMILSVKENLAPYGTVGRDMRPAKPLSSQLQSGHGR